jgi:hypothetical protein
VMALFGPPVALEDNAFRACLAALDIQESRRTRRPRWHLVELAPVAESVAGHGIPIDRSIGPRGSRPGDCFLGGESAPTILLLRAGSARGRFAGVVVPAVGGSGDITTGTGF